MSSSCPPKGEWRIPLSSEGSTQAMLQGAWAGCRRAILNPSPWLGSPSNNVKKSFVRWASHCVVCGPPVETERPARALKKKDVKKVQPVWLQVEQKREPVWLLLTFVNSFWLNSFLNSFPNSFWKFCTILTLLFLVPLYLCGHLCGGPPGPAVVPVLCHGFRG